MHEFPVACHQRRSRFVVEAEFRVAGDARELGQAIFVGKADEPAAGDSFQERLCMDIGEVQHVHHDVGVKNEVHWRAQKNSQL